LNAEVGNILGKYHRFQGLTKRDVQEALEAFKDLDWSIAILTSMKYGSVTQAY
jgi:hypothetical protein